MWSLSLLSCLSSTHISNLTEMCSINRCVKNVFPQKEINSHHLLLINCTDLYPKTHIKMLLTSPTILQHL